MTCECCGAMALVWRTNTGTAVRFGCHCTDEMFCRTCNKCEKHCKCAVAQRELDVPLSEQLLVAKYELGKMGARA